MSEKDSLNGRSAESVSETTRRQTLKRIGATSLGLAAGLGGSAGTVVADHNGDEWEEFYSFTGYEDNADGSTSVKECDFHIRYLGWDDHGDEIVHHFGFTLASHTYAGNKSCSYCSVSKSSGEYYQEGSRFLVDLSEANDVNMSINKTYPGYVTSQTSTTWSEVVKQDDDTLGTYESNVEDEVYQETSDTNFADLMAYLALKAMESVSSGVGDAAELALLIFDTFNDDSNFCGEQKIEGDPAGYLWDFCGGSGNLVVPLQWHHGKIGIKVDNDGTDHQVSLTQDVMFDDYTNMYYNNESTAVEWDLTLPGYHSSATYNGEREFKKDYSG